MFLGDDEEDEEEDEEEDDDNSPTIRDKVIESGVLQELLELIPSVCVFMQCVVQCTFLHLCILCSIFLFVFCVFVLCTEEGKEDAH